MRIPAFTAKKGFGQINVHMPKVNDDEIQALKSKLDAMSRDIDALTNHVRKNRRAIWKLLDVFAAHSVIFDTVGIATVYQLAGMNGNERRSAYSRMTKSEFWPANEADQMTKSQFDDICEAAKVVTED